METEITKLIKECEKLIRIGNMELYLKNWKKKLLDELTRTRELKIISPFVSEKVLKEIQKKFDFKNFELITRYNLEFLSKNVVILFFKVFSVQLPLQ